MSFDASLITTVGFPAFICLWFMYRIEPLIKTNNEVLALTVDYLKKKKN